MLDSIYYSQLTVQEKFVYDQILSSVLRHESAFTTGNLSQGASRRAMRAVVFEHPEIVYLNTFVYPALEAQGRQRIPFEYCEVDQSLFDRKLDALVGKIRGKLNGDASDYVKCKAIFDELAQTVNYPQEAYRDYVRLVKENANQSRFIQKHALLFSPYGVLIDRKGVCQGISKLFQILCARFNVQCAYVEAVIKKGNEPHALNIVEIDGKRAFVDVTWGLAGKDHYVKYDMFLRSRRYVEQFFELSEDFGACDDESLSFYAHNKTNFSNMIDLKRYLCSYRIYTNGSAVYVQYNSETPIDDKLDKKVKEICDETLFDHCVDGKTIHSTCEFGTYTGIIIDSEED